MGGHDWLAFGTVWCFLCGLFWRALVYIPPGLNADTATPSESPIYVSRAQSLKSRMRIGPYFCTFFLRQYFLLASHQGLRLLAGLPEESWVPSRCRPRTGPIAPEAPPWRQGKGSPPHCMWRTRTAAKKHWVEQPDVCFDWSRKPSAFSNGSASSPQVLTPRISNARLSLRRLTDRHANAARRADCAPPSLRASEPATELNRRVLAKFQNPGEEYSGRAWWLLSPPGGQATEIQSDRVRRGALPSGRRNPMILL